MTVPRLENTVFKVRTLVEEYRKGRIVVPEFQRDYVWKKSRAPLLIDSLHRGYPVSVLLLWSGTEDPRARRAQPRPAGRHGLSWLIDGQQRVITLSRVLNGDEGIVVVYNPDEDSFKLENAATQRDPKWIPIVNILDEDLFRQLRKSLPDGASGERHEARFEAVRRILDYEIPAVHMIDHSFENAVDAFTRINTLGVKLKREDIESAKVAARHSGFIVEEVIPFLEKVRRDGFTRMNIMHLFRVCAFIAIPDGRTRTPLHELSRRDVSAAWNKTMRATIDAIDLVRNEFGLVNMDLLWSGGLMVPVIAMCHLMPTHSRNGRAIAGWLAMAALLHRYSGASETAIDQDLKACRAPDPIGALLTNLRRDKGPSRATPDDFAGSLNDKGALFGAYVACRQLGLKDLLNGSPLNLSKGIERHHILPRAQFKSKEASGADCVANIAFVSAGANRQIAAASPDVYLSEVPKGVLTSQCIPLNQELWRINQAANFFDKRCELLAASFNSYLREVLPNRKI